MTMRNIQPVIHILSEVIRSNQVDAEKVNDALDILEDVKDNIGLEDDEVIYKIDELQDYLQDLITLEEPSATREIKRRDNGDHCIPAEMEIVGICLPISDEEASIYKDIR